MQKINKWLTPAGLSQLQRWAQDDLSYSQLALKIGIHATTLHDWCRKHPPIATALGYTNHTADIAYRVILSYSPQEGSGFICASYASPEDAWHDYRIQRRFKDFHITPDFNNFQRTVEHGKHWRKPWAIGGMTVLRCRVTKSGHIHAA